MDDHTQSTRGEVEDEIRRTLVNLFISNWDDEPEPSSSSSGRRIKDEMQKTEYGS
jgi:hypothetical protein